MRLHTLVPASVVQYLQSEGLPARADVLPEVKRASEDVWRSQSGTTGTGSTATSTAGTVGRGVGSQNR